MQTLPKEKHQQMLNGYCLINAH